MMSILVKLGITLGVIYIICTSMLLYLNGNAYHLENHVLLVQNGGVHLYTKEKLVEIKNDTRK